MRKDKAIIEFLGRVSDSDNYIVVGGDWAWGAGCRSYSEATRATKSIQTYTRCSKCGKWVRGLHKQPYICQSCGGDAGTNKLKSIPQRLHSYREGIEQSTEGDDWLKLWSPLFVTLGGICDVLELSESEKCYVLGSRGIDALDTISKMDFNLIIESPK